MSQRRYYSAEEATEGLEAHLARFTPSGSPVYLAVIFLVAACLAALFVVRVEVVVRSPGVIRPIVETHDVVAGVSGQVRQVHVDRLRRVAAGAPLITLDDSHLAEQGAAVERRLAEVRTHQEDLERLTAADLVQQATAPRLTSPRYRQEWLRVQQELRALLLREEQLEAGLRRTRELRARNLVPRIETENQEFQLSGVRAEAAALIEGQRSSWQSSLVEARAEVDVLVSRREEVAEARARYRIYAPVDGTVEHLTPLSPGSWLQVGHPIATISPTTDLVAEVYVTPRDVGMIRDGVQVRLLVDAYRYTDWGTLPGRVEGIAEDFSTMGGQPVFRVLVALEETYLELRGGTRGGLRKGMTLQARFRVAERTLWQLLRDGVEDWIHPSRGPLAATL